MKAAIMSTVAAVSALASTTVASANEAGPQLSSPGVCLRAPEPSPGRIHGGPGDDVIVGAGGVVHGDEDNDRIYAGRSAIQAFGDEGEDLLDGGMAGDELDGGPGRDTLVGELEADRFIYRDITDSPAASGGWSRRHGDTIVDFTPKEGDRIDVSRLRAEDRSSRGGFRWSCRGGAPFGVWAAPNRGDTLVFVETTGDGHADLAIRLLGRIRLTAADFCGVE